VATAKASPTNFATQGVRMPNSRRKLVAPRVPKSVTSDSNTDAPQSLFARQNPGKLLIAGKRDVKAQPEADIETKIKAPEIESESRVPRILAPPEVPTGFSRSEYTPETASESTAEQSEIPKKTDESTNLTNVDENNGDVANIINPESSNTVTCSAAPALVQKRLQAVPIYDSPNYNELLSSSKFCEDTSIRLSCPTHPIPTTCSDILARQHSKKTNINLMQQIAEGGFSKIFKTEAFPEDGQLLILKVVDAAVCTKTNSMLPLEAIRRERVALERLAPFKHGCIVSMKWYHDESPLSSILALEYCDGGDLLERLRLRGGVYSEESAKKVMAELFLALSFIHKCGIMHRDLKLENVLLSSKEKDSGIKVADFGLAKTLSVDDPMFPYPRSNFVCGSDHYLAPELIKQHEYGREVDMWAIGVIAYCLNCHGKFPFNIMIGQDIEYPHWVGENARYIINQLLDRNPETRMEAEDGMRLTVFDLMEAPLIYME